MKRSLALVFSVVIAIALGTAAFGETKALATTTNKTVVDGVVNPAEYSFSQDFEQLAIYVNRTADTLYLGLVGKTSGWVALGLGSMKMDGSTIFIGFVGADGKAQFKPQAGAGHGHKDVSADVAATVISSAMKEADGKTTLEIALKPAAYIKAGQSALQVIYAQGTEKSFIPRHMFRGALSIPLTK